jgi:3alpha(or 20beta)-hydroxysteroid dehydrogenase
MSRLAGKTAIITGASRGMGESHARCFVREGAKVLLTDMRVPEGEALAKELGANARFIHHDVTPLSQKRKRFSGQSMCWSTMPESSASWPRPPM